jgi:hypothetical protein
MDRPKYRFFILKILILNLLKEFKVLRTITAKISSINVARTLLRIPVVGINTETTAGFVKRSAASSS